MAHSKRTKSTKTGSQKHTAAKQAAKKKSKGAVKFRNEELRTMLDSQCSLLYPTNEAAPIPNLTPDNPSHILLESTIFVAKVDQSWETRLTRRRE
ncbi:hypothetical protein Hypma_002396 [Hypsizygus marmoreus]|uniref:Uncharacterized protein n=1 Tax=Hypsizygus marmoreus TaxID=39966 RepID=A0A369J4P2_HYPMA|nr:hypothetical protein Hypma_002396 [Hypsizygus marmoreus]